MSRPLHGLPPAATAARDGLPAAEAADFERLAHAVLSAPSPALGPVLRAQLPGNAGVRWLSSVGLSPTTRVPALDKDPAAPHHSQARGGPLQQGRSGPRGGGRPSTHGHAPGAHAIPRWQ